MKKYLYVGITGLFVSVLSFNLHASDRDGRFILELGSDIGQTDGYDTFQWKGSAELAVFAEKKWSIVVNGVLNKIDSPNEQIGNNFSLGIKHYVLPKTSLAIFAGHTHNRIEVRETITTETADTFEEINSIYDVTVSAPHIGLTVKQRLLPSTSLFSPYISAGTLISGGDAVTKGKINHYYEDSWQWVNETSDAHGVVKYEYDTSVELSGGIGIDINFSQNFALVLGADFGRVFGGGSITIGDEKQDFDKDAYSWWTLGAAMKLYL